MEKKPIEKFNTIEKERIEQYIKGALDYPLRFYTLLLLSGMTSVQAQKLMFDIKFSMTRSANIEVRRKLLKLLTRLINILTTDSIIYNRLRSLAMSRNLDTVKEEALLVLQCHGFTEKSLKVEETRIEASKLLNSILSENGVTGTGLGVVGGNSPVPTQGIDSFDSFLGKKKKIIRRRK